VKKPFKLQNSYVIKENTRNITNLESKKDTEKDRNTIQKHFAIEEFTETKNNMQNKHEAQSEIWGYYVGSDKKII